MTNATRLAKAAMLRSRQRRANEFHDCALTVTVCVLIFLAAIQYL